MHDVLKVCILLFAVFKAMLFGVFKANNFLFKAHQAYKQMWSVCPQPHLPGLQDKPLHIPEITTQWDFNMCIKYIHVCHCCGVELQHSITFCDDMENCRGVYTAEIDGGLCSVCQNSDMYEKDREEFFVQVSIIHILFCFH